MMRLLLASGFLALTGCVATAGVNEAPILHYVRANSDGSFPEHVVQYFASADRIEVYKWVEKCSTAAYVTAEFDPARREATTLYAGKVGQGGEQERFGTLALDQASRALTLRLGEDVAASAADVGSPWYLFDYDFADLNAALRQGGAKESFAFDLMLAWPEGETLTLRRVGKVEARLRGTERNLRRFDLHLGGSADAAGHLLVDPAAGHIVEARFAEPNHAEYRDFALKLERTDHGEAAWRALLSGHYRDCPEE